MSTAQAVHSMTEPAAKPCGSRSPSPSQKPRMELTTELANEVAPAAKISVSVLTMSGNSIMLCVSPDDSTEMLRAEVTKTMEEKSRLSKINLFLASVELKDGLSLALQGVVDGTHIQAVCVRTHEYNGKEVVKLIFDESGCSDGCDALTVEIHYMDGSMDRQSAEWAQTNEDFQASRGPELEQLRRDLEALAKTWGFVEYQIKICVMAWVLAPSFSHGTFVDNCPLPATIRNTKLIIRPDGSVRYTQTTTSGMICNFGGKAYSAENGDMHIEIQWDSRETGQSWVRKVKLEGPDVLAIERFWLNPHDQQVMAATFQRSCQ